MCRIIKSEVILSSYFKKYPKRKKITYQNLKEIRFKAEPALSNVYLDVTYSSIRSVKDFYPESIKIENQCIRIVGSAFRRAQLVDTITFNELIKFL